MQSRERHLLREELAGGTYGTTDEGNNFALKRLNPADDNVYVTGVPDGSGNLSYAQNFKNQRVLSSSDIAGFSGEQWHADIVLVAHPLICYVIHQWDDSGHHNVTVQLNAQLSSYVPADPANWTLTDYFQTVKSFKDQCEKYRVMYTGLTGNMVSSDMYNAGSVTAGQYVWEPMNLNYFRYITDDPGATTTYFTFPVKCFPDNLKSYTQLCQMPNAYTNDAKYGFYMPLKIYDNNYRNTNERVYFVQSDQVSQNAPGNNTAYDAKGNLPVSESIGPLINQALLNNTYFPNVFPLGCVEEQSLYGQENLDFSSYYMGQISIRNISSQAQFYLTFRSGYQMVCTPGSMFTQYITSPLSYDIEAIQNYTAMVNYLQDCYPDAYNDWGLLKQKLINAWNRAKPFLRKAVEYAQEYAPKILPYLM